MRKAFAEFFESLGIEYFSAIEFSECELINDKLISRIGFEPKTVILFLMPYYAGEPVNLSAYASVSDYHRVFRGIEAKFVDFMKKHAPVSHFCGFADHSPIDERLAAAKCGLGILGKNRLLINEKYGTYVFIGEIFTDIEKENLFDGKSVTPKTCEGCDACIKACPTGILCGSSSECLSAITQKKGELTEDDLRLMREVNTVWGCDVCQKACPHNKSPRLTPIKEFYEDKIQILTSDVLDAMTDEQLSERPFGWRKRKTVKRNLEKLGY